MFIIDTAEKFNPSRVGEPGSFPAIGFTPAWNSRAGAVNAVESLSGFFVRIQSNADEHGNNLPALRAGLWDGRRWNVSGWK